MGSFVIAVYRPKEGKDIELLGCVRSHMDVLRDEGLVSDAEPLLLRAADGSIVEIFEWMSEEALNSEHHHPAVRALWERFCDCSTYGTLSSLPGANRPFAQFELLEMELPYAD